MTIEEVKQIIADSKFDPGLKQRLALLLPSLGKFTLSGLGKEVSRGDSLVIGEYLVTLWQNFGNLLDALKQKNEDGVVNLSKFLDENLHKSNTDDKLYMLSFVMDARAMAERS